MKCKIKNPTTKDCRKCSKLKKCEDGKFLIDLEKTLGGMLN